ncbi:MAG: helix-turn-helix transcriptional regulator [Oscillospiraceae bacterium]|jgi:transcriptional regulator with XRE-family HTH domain|nr:helix-turn-helix transcriptional regulator [Oscillospiraceae bacterium]
MQKSVIAENTRRIISIKGMKQRAVALRAGISEQQFSALLNNRRVIRDIDVIAIANALEVTPNDLFGLTEPAERG